MKDLYHNNLAVKSILSILGNNTGEGTGIAVDLQGFEGALAIFNIGQSGDTLSGSVYITVSLQESENGSTGWASPAAADVEGVNDVVIDDPAEDEIIIQIGYKGSKRYLRAYIAFDGTHTNGIPIGAVIVKGFPRHAPVI